MEKRTFIVAIIFILLAFIIGVLTVEYWQLHVQQQRAIALSASVLTYINHDYRGCRNNPEDFEMVRRCVLDLIERIESETAISLERADRGYRDVDVERNETGYLILENTGEETLESERFVLLKNLEVADRGCAIEGAIEPGYTCRLDFTTPCLPGDVLDVRYKEKSVYLHTC